MSAFRISLQYQPRMFLLNNSEEQNRHTVNKCGKFVWERLFSGGLSLN